VKGRDKFKKQGDPLAALPPKQAGQNQVAGNSIL